MQVGGSAGVAFGAALLASAPAIVAYFALPTAWSALVSLPFLDGVAPWVDTIRAIGPMSEEVLSATEWAQAATTLVLWMVAALTRRAQVSSPPPRSGSRPFDPDRVFDEMRLGLGSVGGEPRRVRGLVGAQHPLACHALDADRIDRQDAVGLDVQTGHGRHVRPGCA